MTRVDNLSEMELFAEWVSLRRELWIPLPYNDYLPNARIHALIKTGKDKTLADDFLRVGVR